MKNKHHITLVVRILATALGMLIGALFLVFMVGEGGHPPLLALRIEALLTWCLVIYLLGILFSLKWLGSGALMGIAGIAGFYLFNFLAVGRLPSGPVFPVMWFPPILLLLCWIFSGSKQSSSAPPPEETP